MPIRIPLCQIGVSRNGTTIFPKISEPFEFTAEEVTEINELQTRTGKKFFDKIVIEDNPVGTTKTGKPKAQVSEEL